MTAKEHYETHLADIYSWMSGDFQTRVTEQTGNFQRLGISKAGTAIDLGCGHGIHAVALAKMGFLVTAVDFSLKLLAELSENAGEHKINIVHSDLLDFLKKPTTPVDLITCMGDTITHLPSLDDVHLMLSLLRKSILADGKIVISFRDLSTEAVGVNRFIPVKSDASRILTCFLEYHPDHVQVHDILLERIENQWIQKISSYPKLRFSANKMISLLSESGFKVVKSENINGLIYVVATL